MPAAILAFTVYGAAAPAHAQPAQGQGHPSTGAAHPDHGAPDHGAPEHGAPDTDPADHGTAGTGPSDHGTAGTPGPSGTAAPKTSDGTGTFDRPNDWQAQADPDGMDNGGVDQPGGTGGTGPQDGNNGSGNDADCEDDNRGRGVPGHCKDNGAPAHTPAAVTSAHASGAPATPETAEAGPATAVAFAASPVDQSAAQSVAQSIAQSIAQPVAPPAQVLGISAIRPRTQPHLGESGQVAGISTSLQPSAGLLPNTGAGELAPLGTAGVVLLAGGAGLLLWRRRLVS